jgi:hypothetical protein
MLSMIDSPVVGVVLRELVSESGSFPQIKGTVASILGMKKRAQPLFHGGLADGARGYAVGGME